MQPLFMPLRLIVPPTQTPLMTRNAILMRLQAPILSPPMTSHRQQIIHKLILRLHDPRLRLPPERQIRRADHLDKIHVIESRVVGQLLRVV